MQKISNRLSLIFSAFLFSSFIYIIVGYALSRTNWKPVLPVNSQQIVFWIFVALAICELFAILKMKDSGRAVEEQTEKQVISRSIILYALAEIPAILGLVYFILSGSFVYQLILWAVSIVSFLLVRPTDE